MNQQQQLVCVLDCHWKLQQANSRFYEVTQYQPKHILSESFDILIDRVCFSSLEVQLAELLKSQTSFSQIVEINTADNRVVPLLFSFTPMLLADDDKIHILCMANVGQQCPDLERKLYQITYTDHLTQLGNRPYFLKKLEEAFKKIEKDKSSVFFLNTFDFDDFKKVDDLYGYKVGDRLLQESAQRLLAVCDKTDVIFRLSGTKFGVLHASDGMEDINVWSQSILYTMTDGYYIEDHLIDLQLSMGVLQLPKDAKNSVDSINRVELAYYKARETRNYSNIVLYHPQLSEETIHILSIEKELKKALTDDDIQVFYQPQFSLPDRELKGFEALARWQHPEKGMISPAEFIPIAEKTGLIIEVGNQVLQKAFEQQVLFLQNGHDYTMSINISAIQLTDSNFLHDVSEAIKATGVDPNSIEFEITESIIMGNLQESIAILEELRKWGISIALDDFGTGYSSLSYIKEIPLDVLKIDRTFLRYIPHNQKDCAIVKTILTLAKELSIEVVAEGGEKEEQVIFLEQLHCDSAQGYYFSHPLRVSEVDKLLEGVGDDGRLVSS